MKSSSKQKLMIFIILSATVALAYQLPYLKYSFYDQMMEALQLNDIQMAGTSTAITLANTICYPLGGILANRFSTRKMILVSLLGMLVTTIAFAFTTNYVLLLIIHVSYGFFGIATLWSAYLAGIRALADADTQSTIFGSSESTRGILQTLCAFLFLALMNHAVTPLMGFRSVMLVGAAIVAVFLVLAWIYLPKEEVKAQEEASEKFPLMSVLTNKGVWITIMVIMCSYTTWTVGNNYLSTYTVRVLGISNTLASSIAIVRSYIIVLAAGFVGGWVLDRFKFKGNGFMIFLSITAVAVAGVMATNKVMPICIGLTLFLALMTNIMKSTYWSIMEQAGIPANMTAFATGIISFIAFIPDFILPMVCGNWITKAQDAGNVAAGFNKIFMLLIAFSIVGVFSAYLLTKQTKQIKNS